MKYIILLIIFILSLSLVNAQKNISVQENKAVLIKTINELESNNDLSELETTIKSLYEKLQFSNTYINSTDRHLSYRLLKVHSVFLEQVKQKCVEYKNDLNAQNNRLNKLKLNIDNSQYPRSNDTAVQRLYNLTLYMYDTTKISLNNLQTTLDSSVMLLTETNHTVSNKLKDFSNSILKATDAPLLKDQSNNYTQGILGVVKDSAETGSKIMMYYLSAHWYAISITVFTCLLFVAWIIIIRKEYGKHTFSYIRTSNIKLKYLSANPLFGSLLLAFSFAPFFFPTPPIIFVELIWTILGLILTILFFKDKNVPVIVRIVWSAFFITFRIVALINLFLYSSFEERWLLLIVNCICLTLDLLIIRTNKRRDIFHKKRTAWVIYISAAMHISAVICNFYGLFNLAKILTATATFAVFTAAVLRVFADTAREAITFQLAMFNRNYSSKYQQHSKKIYNVLSKCIDVFAVVSWCTMFIYNLNLIEMLQSL